MKKCAISPDLPSVLNVFVDYDGHSHCNQCHVPGCHEHNGNTQSQTEQ